MGLIAEYDKNIAGSNGQELSGDTVVSRTGKDDNQLGETVCVQGIRDLRFPAYYLQRLLKIETNVFMIQIELRAFPGVTRGVIAMPESFVSA